MVQFEMHAEIFISRLRNQLNKSLPGKAAQLIMAPSYRHLFPLNTKESDAGILILIYPKENDVYTVFMKRPEYPGAHGGQISFPGGRYEISDSTLEETALRETEEEFGIHKNSIAVLGKLTPLFIPVSRYEVHPFIGYIHQQPEFKPDPKEVEYLIETDIFTLLDPTIQKSKPALVENFNGEIPYFDIKGHQIWGATAMILSEFITIARRII
jgi:8-oxo-dGTP pyrophosphatase MutT (NUDIX family)